MRSKIRSTLRAQIGRAHDRFENCGKRNGAPPLHVPVTNMTDRRKLHDPRKENKKCAVRLNQRENISHTQSMFGGFIKEKSSSTVLIAI